MDLDDGSTVRLVATGRGCEDPTDRQFIADHNPRMILLRLLTSLTRPFYRGVTDTFEHLVAFLIGTVVWWICILLIIPAPGATLTLFSFTDPRHSAEGTRPGWRDGATLLWDNVWRGWGLTVLTIPIVALLALNIGFYANQTSQVRLLTPLWFMLFVLGLAISLVAFSLTGMLDYRTLAALRLASLIVGAHLPMVLVVSVLLGLFAAISGVLVIPAVLFAPATIAATINRITLTSLRIPIVNPLTPTEERIQEDQARD